MFEKLTQDFSSLTVAGKIELSIFSLWTILLPIVTALDYVIDARYGPMTVVSVLPQLFTFSMPAIYIVLGLIGQKSVRDESLKDRFERTSFDSDDSLQKQNLRFEYLIKLGIAAGLFTLLIWGLTVAVTAA